MSRTVETLKRELQQSIKVMMDKGQDTSVRSAMSNLFRYSVAELHKKGYHVTISMVLGKVEVEVRSMKDVEKQ